MIVLYLNDRKKLCAKQYSDNFEGENSFEIMRIIAEDEISGHRLKDCTVECHIINPRGSGDIVQLAFLKKGKYEAEVLLSGRYTAVDGELTLFLKIFSDGDAIGLTNEVKIGIKRHKAVTSYIEDGQLTLLDQYSRTMQTAAEIIEHNVNEKNIDGYIENYLENHEIVGELTEDDIKVLF